MSCNPFYQEESSFLRRPPTPEGESPRGCFRSDLIPSPYPGLPLPTPSKPCHVALSPPPALKMGTNRSSNNLKREELPAFNPHPSGRQKWSLSFAVGGDTPVVGRCEREEGRKPLVLLPGVKGRKELGSALRCQRPRVNPSRLGVRARKGVKGIYTALHTLESSARKGGGEARQEPPPRPACTHAPTAAGAG